MLLAVLASSRVSFSPSDETPVFSQIIRLTSGPGREWAPVISPDGKWVAYLSNARGPTDIWVQFIAGGEAINLSAPAGLEVTPGTGIGGLDMSPDGTRIAVIARMRGTGGPFETWEVPAPLSGPARKLLADFVGFRWSPDGKQIAFIRAGGSAGDALWVANADGTNRREIIPLGGGRHIHWPAWSPDGLIYFIDTKTSLLNMEPSEISRIDPARPVIEPVIATARRAIFPMPLPTGRGFIYAANPDTAELGLWWRASNGGPSRPITVGLGEYAEPRVSADGRSLVCTLYDVHQSLIRVPLDENTGTASPITQGFTGDLDPSVSRSGDRLVFSSSRAGNRHLWTSAIDGSSARPLTSGPALDERPVISPDGRDVAFISDRDGKRAVWLISAEGGAPRKLADANVLGSLAWSRDGRRLTFAGTSGNDWPGLWELSVADGRVRRIPTNPDEAVGDTAPSPVADVIAYVAATTRGVGTSRVAIVDTSGRPVRGSVPDMSNIKIDGFALNGLLAWAPDGKRLAVVSQGTNTPSISILDFEGPRPVRKLIEFSGGPRLRGISWTRDGAAIIVGKHDVGSSDIVMMTARD
jgi:Tol biopolymer transport system component